MSMLSYTKTTKEKLESILQTAGYKVRYEKGNFLSGYCLVQDQRVAVVNKFFDLQGRIDTLVELILHVQIDESLLDEKQTKFYKICMQHVVSNNLQSMPLQQN
jgi:hypothetical protein